MIFTTPKQYIRQLMMKNTLGYLLYIPFIKLTKEVWGLQGCSKSCTQLAHTLKTGGGGKQKEVERVN